MATRAHQHSRRSRRTRNAVGDQWLVALIARTLATIISMVVARLLGLSAPPH
jgi:hypothetical protein